MKRWLPVLMLAIMLTGCAAEDQELSRAMMLRERLLTAKGCSFTAQITADYADVLYSFTMECTADQEGEVTFTVTAPQTIAGITGILGRDGGRLTFDSTALAFDMLAEGQISPVSGPWILLSTLRGGYLTACAREEENLRLSIDDSYEDDALHLDIWLDSEDRPIRGEILWQGRRIVSMNVSNFAIG